MEEIKRIFNKKILLFLLPSISSMAFIFIIFIAIIGFSISDNYIKNESNNLKLGSSVINNQLYASKYKKVLNKYLLSKGYVSLERMVFYLQRTNNILDTSTLDYEIWDKAYIDNLDVNEKQMIPIKLVCSELSNDFTIESGINADGYQIDVIDLCNFDSEEDNNYYNEILLPLPYSFPLKDDFTITSMIYEHRNIDLGLSAEEQASLNYHSGWDLAVSIGTNFYSICDGKISNITNTQANDLVFKESGNSTGNSISVICDNGLTASYLHIKYKSTPSDLKVGSFVKKGDLLGKTSTTGRSTGGHLHLGLKDAEGSLLDALAYIDFTNYK